MRILFFTQWFEPEPTFKGLTFARALKDAGHEVEVVTGFPNYPGGKVYPGYRIQWLQKENVEGIRVNRVPLYPSHDSSAIGRVLNYGSFALAACLYGLFGVRKADVIYVYHPPMPIGFAAAVVSLLRGMPLVVDINDLWPDTLEATGMIRSKRLLRMVGSVCQWIYRRATRIVVVSPGFRERLLARGVPAEKIELIYNWCDEHALRVPEQVNPRDFGMDRRFNVVFAGNLGKAQALHVVVRVAQQVRSIAPHVQFVFVGDGIETKNLEKLARDIQADNLRFLPRMPMAEISRVLAAADVLLVHLKDEPLFEITVPSKTQAYMAVGKPILMAVKGDAAHLIEDSGAGICALPENEASLANAVFELARLPSAALAEMGRRGSEYYMHNLSMAAGTGKFLKLFEACTLARSAPA
jgi:putative colanic acid biosynthesis glycosyltransferase WcaI